MRDWKGKEEGLQDSSSIFWTTEWLGADDVFILYELSWRCLWSIRRQMCSSQLNEGLEKILGH